jgi:hypothetical protein
MRMRISSRVSRVLGSVLGVLGVLGASWGALSLLSVSAVRAEPFAEAVRELPADQDPRPLLILALQSLAHRAGLRVGDRDSIAATRCTNTGTSYTWTGVSACFAARDANVGVCVSDLEVTVQARWDSSTPPTAWPMSVRPDSFAADLAAVNASAAASVAAAAAAASTATHAHGVADPPLGTQQTRAGVTYSVQTSDALLLPAAR